MTSSSPTPDAFRQAWGNFPTGVSVVTFARDDGKIHGITATAVCPVSLDPLLVLVCVAKQARSHALLASQERFVMNLLAEGQTQASRFFASSGPKENPPFEFERSAHGGLVIAGSAAYLDCRIVRRAMGGDHTILIGEVEEVQTFARSPLVYFAGRYIEVGPKIAAEPVPPLPSPKKAPVLKNS